jgi:glyceraldehyde-3-phosphate dehydrogenase (NADP+)
MARRRKTTTMSIRTCDPMTTEAGAAELTSRWGIPGGAYWGGRWRNERLCLEVTDPEDGSVLARVHAADSADIAEAVSGVAESLRADDWPLWQRREALERAARMLSEEGDRLAEIISAESSKTITEAIREVARAAETLRLSAAASDALEGGTLPLDDSARGAGRVGWTRRLPVGVVAAITPFNDPMNLVAHKLGPALIGGNAVVLKPSQETPLSALALVDVLLRAGVAPRRVAVSAGEAGAGEALVSDRRVDLISFTGGPRTGERIARSAGARKLLMELGGNNAVIVCADAAVEAAAAAIVDGAFGVAGQNCLSVQRVYAHASVYDELVRQVTRGTKELVVGTKRSPNTDVGPLISVREAQRIEEWVDEARAGGAIVRTGGRRTGNFLEPTVITDAAADARIVTDEVFGPVVTIHPFSDLDDALARADSTEYGLQAGVFTESVQTAFYAAERLNVGTVLINDTSDFRIDAMPFGGFKRSGIGREGVRSAVEAMTEPRNIIVNAPG